MATPDPDEVKPQNCPKCGQALTPGVKFCETCGERIGQPPVCPHCKNPLTPGVKFCESCGKPVGSQPAPPAPAAVVPPLVAEPAFVAPESPLEAGRASLPEPVSAAQDKVPDKKAAKKLKETGKKTQKKTPAPPDETIPALQPEPAPVVMENLPDTPAPVKPVETIPMTMPAVQVPPEEKVPALPPQTAGVVTENMPDKKIPGNPEDTARKTPEQAPASRTRTLVIAGVIGLVILAVLAYFVLLPMLSGQGSAGIGSSLSLPGSPPPPSAVPTGSAAQSTSAASFEPQPTQRMPVNLEVTYQAERNNINGLITVTFAGGPGMNGISQTVVTLTKSDGTVEKKTFKPKQIGDSVTLQGTLKTDRLEVIANFYNGDTYRVIDQLFEYKKKN